jgi:hypothetical protein
LAPTSSPITAIFLCKSARSDFSVRHYVDVDSGAGFKDYQNGDRSYDGHKGTDFGVPNFRSMDENFPILAAAPGIVLSVIQDNYDRNIGTPPPDAVSNAVEVQHENGYVFRYSHLKQWSVVVNIGDQVQAGQKLAVVGSSGQSGGPHLHFAILDTGGNVVDPFLEELWISPPEYELPISLMDVVLTDEPISDIATIIDPSDNVSSIPYGGTLGIGLAVAGGDVGSEIAFRLRDADGEVLSEGLITFRRNWASSKWYWNMRVSEAVDEVIIEVLFDDIIVFSQQLPIE